MDYALKDYHQDLQAPIYQDWREFSITYTHISLLWDSLDTHMDPWGTSQAPTLQEWYPRG